MYRIEITNNGMIEVLHDVNANSYRRAASGTFTRDLYAVHSATITVYPQNPCFEHLHELTTLVKIINTKTGRIMFDGHILQIPDNSMTDGGKFEKKLLCESELGYLCDSTQLLHNYGEVDNTSFLAGCLDYHNEQMAQSPERQILLGAVSQHGMHQKVTSYRSTMEEIKQNLISVNGGILDLQRNANQKLVLNYWQDSDYGNVCNTKIELAHNLKSLTLGTDMTGVITRLFPLGAVINSETGERLTVSSVNNNCPYIDDLEAIGKWGIKTGTVTFDDVTNPSILLSRGREYILTVNQAKRTFQANVLDLSTIGADADEFDIGNQYLFDVNRMGLHEYLRVTQMTVDIYKPYQPQITIGDKLERITDITTQARNYIAFEAPKQYSSILQQAKTNTSALIAAATTGYVVLYPNDCPREILIMDTDDIHTAKSVWRMNRNGIGYSHSDVAGEAYDGEYGIAMTMDGAIVADFITAGYMYADRIRGGTLVLGGQGTIGDESGVMQILDGNNVEICRLDKNGAKIFGEVFTKKNGYWLKLADGKLTGGEGDNDTPTATIDTSAVIEDGDHHIDYHGLKLSSDVVYLDCNFFAINGATGVTGDATVVTGVSAQTASQNRIFVESWDSSTGELWLNSEQVAVVTGVTWSTQSISFRNGIMCTNVE